MKFATLFANKPLQITLIVVGLIIGIYLWGKKSANDKQKYDAELPDNGTGIPAGWSPQPIADKLYEVMDGIFQFGNTKEEEWRLCLSLTDDQLTAVYVAFNRTYCRDNNETLTSWIEDETGIAFNSAKPRLLNRLRSLNLN